MKLFSNLSQKITKFIATVALITTLCFGVISLNAQPEIWCPPCSSDICQDGDADFVIIVAGSCFCCYNLG